ncbi:MAG: hypothetical protein V1918_05570 [Planctomycetota bacterium]
MPEETLGQKMQCPVCREEFFVPKALEGHTGHCPVCNAHITFPGKIAKQVVTKCPHCQAVLKTSDKNVGKVISCPRCRNAVTVIVWEEKEEGVTVDDQAEPTFRPFVDDRRTYLAWDDLDQRRKDTYHVALLRTLLYPVQALGVICFFIVGIPVLYTVIRLAGDEMLFRMGARGLAGMKHAASGVIIFMILSFTSMAGVVSTFIFSIIRVSAAGGGSVPVVQGERHRWNLAALATWFFLYTGPGLYMGFLRAGDSFWKFNPWVVIFWILLLPIAPMGLLLVTLHGGSKVFDFPSIFKAISNTAWDYTYLFGIALASTGLFVYLGFRFDSLANELLSSGDPRYFWGFVARVAAGCFFAFPVITFARQLGLFAHYHEDKLPFLVDPDRKTPYSFFSELVLLTGLVLFFFPLNQYAQKQNIRGFQNVRCVKNLQFISNVCVKKDQIWREFPKNEEELVKRFPRYCRCPYVVEREEQSAKEESPTPPSQCDYVVESLPLMAPMDLMVIYDKEGNHPDGTRNVLFVIGDVVERVSPKRFNELKSIQDLIVNNLKDEEANEVRLNRMRTLRIMP